MILVVTGCCGCQTCCMYVLVVGFVTGMQFTTSKTTDSHFPRTHPPPGHHSPLYISSFPSLSHSLSPSSFSLALFHTPSLCVSFHLPPSHPTSLPLSLPPSLLSTLPLSLQMRWPRSGWSSIIQTLRNSCLSSLFTSSLRSSLATPTNQIAGSSGVTRSGYLSATSKWSR